MGRARIGELLVEAKVINPGQLAEALRGQGDSKKLGQVLVELGYVTEAQLTQTLSLQLSVPWVSLYHIDFSRQLLNMVPREIAERYCVVPIFVRNVKKVATLYVAMDDPTNETALAEIAGKSGMPVKPMIASPSDIRSAIRVYYEGATAPAEAPPLKQPESAPRQLSSSPPAPAPPKAIPSAPPPAPAKPPPAPPVGRAPLPTVVDTIERFATAPLSSRASEDPMRAPSPSGDAPDVDPELEVGEYVPQRKSSAPRMVALTLLDGTTLTLPAARPSQPSKSEIATTAATTATPAATAGVPAAGPTTSVSDQLTARDLISALRAHSHGADASEILGNTDWQAMFAALLSLLLKKNLIADWEFVEELRNS